MRSIPIPTSRCGSNPSSTIRATRWGRSRSTRSSSRRRWASPRCSRKTDEAELISRLGFGLRQVYAKSFEPSTLRKLSSNSNDGGFEFQTDVTEPMLDKKIIYKGQLLVFWSVFYSKSDELEDFDRRVTAGEGAIPPSPAHESVGDFWKEPDVSFQNTFTAGITEAPQRQPVRPARLRQVRHQRPTSIPACRSAIRPSRSTRTCARRDSSSRRSRSASPTRSCRRRFPAGPGGLAPVTAGARRRSGGRGAEQLDELRPLPERGQIGSRSSQSRGKPGCVRLSSPSTSIARAWSPA